MENAELKQEGELSEGQLAAIEWLEKWTKKHNYGLEVGVPKEDAS